MLDSPILIRSPVIRVGKHKARHDDEHQHARVEDGEGGVEVDGDLSPHNDDDKGDDTHPCSQEVGVLRQPRVF